MFTTRASGSRVWFLALSIGVAIVCARSGAEANTPTTDAEAARFLEQATFGPTPEAIAYVKSVGIEQFLNQQFTAWPTGYPSMPLYPTTAPADCPSGSICRRDNYSMYPLQTRFYLNALYGPDQLRQRVAFALHQIMVVSGVDITMPGRMTPYLQILHRNAFGNFRQLLYEITLNPAMGNYLDMAGNTRTNPNENYPREVLQLFSIGLYQLNPDGTRRLDGFGRAIPSYDQTTVTEFSKVFTGWNFATPPGTGFVNYDDPMVATQSRHDIGAKTLLRGVVLPANQTALKDLNDGLDNIFNDPNVGPFIGKQLIQHLVMSNPSPAYVERVSTTFDNNGLGVRGDLQAVVRAILMDPEARTVVPNNLKSGHLRHPALFIAGFLRAFNARSSDRLSLSDGYLNPQGEPMGLDVYRPPSVFSYFSPNTLVPDTTVSGPEFGILNTSTVLKRTNFINTMVFSRIGVSTNAPLGTSIDLSPWQPLAANPAQLVASLNDLLTHGSLSPEVQSSIVTAVSAVTATNTLKRVRTAVYLIGTSSQYQVQQ